MNDDVERRRRSMRRELAAAQRILAAPDRYHTATLAYAERVVREIGMVYCQDVLIGNSQLLARVFEEVWRIPEVISAWQHVRDVMAAAEAASAEEETP